MKRTLRRSPRLAAKKRVRKSESPELQQKLDQVTKERDDLLTYIRHNSVQEHCKNSRRCPDCGDCLLCVNEMWHFFYLWKTSQGGRCDDCDQKHME